MARPRAADDFAAIRARMKELRRESHVARPRAADDFAAIRARMEELRRERNPALPSGEEPGGVGRLPGIPDDGGHSAGAERGWQEKREARLPRLSPRW